MADGGSSRVRFSELSQEEFSRLSAALDRSLTMSAEHQATFLSELERCDRAVAKALLGLLGAQRKAEGFLESCDFLADSLVESAMARPPTQAGLVGRHFGPYRVVSPLGHGGMGSVWLAERADGVFDRKVALKLVHPALMGGRATERFAREREILAGLMHPNIARLLDAGFADDGQPYLALEYVEGVPITSYCNQHRLRIAERLRLFSQVLAAVQYAHSRLVIHRDLKPSNILVTPDGDARLLDFGIAKLLTEGQAKETELTQLGGRALTPDYAAPEQIAGAPITIAADVYALGVMLCELLSGQLPYRFKRASRGAIEEAILEAEPISPSRATASSEVAQARGVTPQKLARTLAGDLDTIVLKALKKVPGERYATVAALKEDLDRFLRGDPVLAQRDSLGYRARKFAQRHRISLSAVAAVIAVLLALLAMTSHEAQVAAEQRDAALRDHLRLLAMTAATRLRDGDAPGAMRLVLEILPLRIAGAGRTWETLSVFEEARAADSQVMALSGHSDRVTSAAFSPDGREIATASYDRTARIWDATTGLQLVSATGHAGWLRSVAFSSDGRHIVTASYDGSARIWDSATGRQLTILTGHLGPVVSAAFSSDGQHVVTSSIDKTARVWNAVTGEPILTIKGHTERVNFAAFFPDGNRILTASDDKTARIWSVATGAELRQLKGHTEYIQGAALSPDGQRAVTTSFDKSARAWDTGTGRQLWEVRYKTPIVAISFSQHGDRVVIACFDNTARILDAESGDEIRMLSGHTAEVHSATFSPDDRRVVTGSSDSTTRVWNTAPRQQLQALIGHSNRVTAASFSRDAQRAITSSYDGTARIWDAATGRQLMALDTGKALTTVAFSPDGRLLVTGSDEKNAGIWDLTSARLLVALQGHKTRVNSAEFSPDGRSALTASNDRTARIWDVASGRQTLQLSGHTDAVIWAAFSPDGRRVVTASADRTARIWDAATGRELLQLDGHTASFETAQFSPNGRQVVTSSDDRTARLWDAESGAQLSELRGHRDVVSGAVFSPDGRRVATSSFDRTVRIWDSRTGQLLVVLTGHSDSVNTVAFCPDGQRIITSSDDKTARVWTAQTPSLQSQIAWSEAAQFDPLSHDERMELGLPALPEVRQWSTGKTDCDAAAAAPYDPERRAPGVMLRDIVVDKALRSCAPRRAHEVMPGRVLYQHGRALMAGGAFKAARQDFQDANNRGYRAAQIDLARLLLHPEAGMLDVAGAVALLEHAWTDGLAVAAFELGDTYERGVRAPGDPAKYLLAPEPGRAWSWYEKAAQAGEPGAIARMAQRADWSARQSPTVAGRNEQWLKAFRLYATAAERARIEDWPEALWQDWRYRRASLARLLEEAGMMQTVAETYDSVRQQQTPPAATIWTRLRVLHRENQ